MRSPDASEGRERLESLGLLAELGIRWRNDWSDFDGRVLRHQLDEIDDIVGREFAGEDVSGAIAKFIKEECRV
jgi:hypothetical protein